METFEKCIELVKRSENPEYHGRKFVWLNHFGEPLLNPLLPAFISYAVSCGIEVSFASNAVDQDRNLFPRSVWQTLASAGLKGVMLSAHVKSQQTLREHIGDIVKVAWMWTPKGEDLHDWAGQVDMSKFRIVERSKPTQPCDYYTHNMFAVTWDGKIAACCYDIEGRVGLTVDDVLQNGFSWREISLCAACRLGRGDVAWIGDPLPQLLG